MDEWSIMNDHNATIRFYSDRVLGTNYKSSTSTKTVGWKTYCFCGEVIETKSNNLKAHQAKVAKHNTEVK
jgi:hypothetical protein